MKKKDIIGWTVFIIGFIIASIFGLNAPPWEQLQAVNLYLVLLLVAELFAIYGGHDLEKSKFEPIQRDALISTGNTKVGIGALLGLVSLVMVITKLNVQQWHWFFVGALIGLAGCGILGAPEEHRHPAREAGESDHINPLHWTTQLIEEVKAIDFDEMNTEEIKMHLEQIELNRLVPFARQRHFFSKEYGPTHFAEFFSVYSTGELYMNRAWSSLVDGYPDESRLSVERALEYFYDTHNKLLSYEK